MNYIERARQIKGDSVAIRRQLHQHPELGYDLPKTVALVKEKLQDMGIEAQDIGESGVTATIGKEGGPVLLLRADMDALPIPEESGFEEPSQIEGRSHACGHDFHTTNLLTAARLLKEDEDKLQGQIKFIFQPAEELLTGGKSMVEAGILENPKVDAAMGLHMLPNAPAGLYLADELAMASALNFEIRVKGVGSHGAMPYNGIDPVYIASQIVVGVPEIIARELPFDESAAITMGRFVADGSMNVIPSDVTIQGTCRSFSNDTRVYVRERLPELVQKIAEAYRGEVEFEILADCPPLINNRDMTSEVFPYLEEAVGEEFPVNKVGPQHASEDFAYYASEVPSAFFNVGAPVPDEENQLYPVHHPKVQFDEDMIPVAAGAMAHAAFKWLENN